MIPLRDLNPSRRRPVVTVALIAINVAVFLYEVSLGRQLQPFLAAAAFEPAQLGSFIASGHGGVSMARSALLSLFLHGGWAHIAGNMLFLWIFGDNVEDRLGHLRFALFYLLAGATATCAHAFADLGSTLPAIGASGAISGVLGAYLFLFPRARVVTLVFLGFFIDFVEVPALVFLPLWFLVQFVSGIASIGAPTAAEAGGVAWFAHIGGFVSGPLLAGAFGAWRR